MGNEQRFEFIHVPNPAGKTDAAYRKDVHARAMRLYRRQQRLQRTQTHQSAIASAANKEASQDAPTPPERAAVTISQSEHLATGMQDPFLAMAIALPGEHQDLLSYYHLVIGPMLLPVGRTRSTASWAAVWLRQAICSPVLLFATCCHAARHAESCSAPSERKLSLELQIRTISELHRVLDDGVTYEAVGAVLLLAANSMIAGEAAELDMHVRGLLKMLSALPRHDAQDIGRGSFAEIVRMCVAWHSCPYEILVQPKTNLLGGRLSQIGEKRTDLAALVTECRELIALQRELFSSTLQGSQLQKFSDRRSTMEYKLSRLHNKFKTSDEHSLTTSVDRAVCAATLIFNYCHLRNFLGGGPTHQSIEAELYRGLLEAEAIMANTDPPASTVEATFWAAMVFLIYQSKANRHLDVKRIPVDAARRLKLAGLEDHRVALRGFIWLEEMETTLAWQALSENIESETW